ncbi:MAG: hypothetical protein ACI97A_000899, partial [Planctomycetota bacterium]
MNKFAVLLVVTAVIGAAFAFYQFQQDEDQTKLEEFRITEEEKTLDEARRSGALVPKKNAMIDAAQAEKDGEKGAETASLKGQRVVGRLVDELGNPIPGVKVTLAEIKNTPSFGFLAPPSLNGRLPKGVHACMSAEDGSFYFTGVKHTARLEVRAWPEEFRSVTSSFSFFSGEEHDVGNLVAEAGAVLSGRVLNAASIPVVGAEVSISVPSARSGGLIVIGGGNTRGTRTVISDEHGYFHAAGLKSGKARVTAKAKGFPPKEGLRVDLSLKAPVEDFLVQLDNGREIFGTVVDAEGKPAKNVTVEFQPARGFNPMWFGQERPKFQADNEGKFVLIGVPLTEVKLKVYGDGYMTRSDHLVPVDKSNTLVKLNNAAMVYGYLKTKDGKKNIKDFEITLTERASSRVFGGSEPTTQTEVRSGAEAAKELGLKPADGFFAVVNISKARAQFQIVAKGFEELKFHERDLEAGEKREITAEVSRDVPFAGTVVDANGDPIEGANVVMTIPNPRSGNGMPAGFSSGIVEGNMPFMTSGNSRHFIKSKADGSFEFRGMVAGNYKLNVRHTEYLNIKDREVVLEKDRPQPDYKITLSSGATLTGIVYDEESNPLPGAQVSLRKKKEIDPNSGDSEMMEFGIGMASQGGLNVVAGEGGAYNFRGIFPGDYIAKAKQPKKRSEGRGMMIVMSGGSQESGGEPVSLQADNVTELDLRIKKKARVFGKVLSGSQPVVGAKVTESSGNSDAWMFGGNSCNTDDSGYFEIENLEPGTHTFRLSLNGSPFVLKKKIELTEGQQLKLDFSVPTGAIMGRALDGEGNPLM